MGESGLWVFWNTVTGNVWVRAGDMLAHDPTAGEPIAAGVFSKSAAYAAIARHGLQRRGDFLLTPGAEHIRQARVAYHYVRGA